LFEIVEEGVELGVETAAGRCLDDGVQDGAGSGEPGPVVCEAAGVAGAHVVGDVGFEIERVFLRRDVGAVLVETIGCPQTSQRTWGSWFVSLMCMGISEQLIVNSEQL
jgi:hypothetical protein